MVTKFWVGKKFWSDLTKSDLIWFDLIYSIWHNSTQPFFIILFSCCSRYVAFVKLIHLNDLFDHVRKIRDKQTIRQTNRHSVSDVDLLCSLGELNTVNKNLMKVQNYGISEIVSRIILYTIKSDGNCGWLALQLILEFSIHLFFFLFCVSVSIS